MDLGSNPTPSRSRATYYMQSAVRTGSSVQHPAESNSKYKYQLTSCALCLPSFPSALLNNIKPHHVPRLTALLLLLLLLQVGAASRYALLAAATTRALAPAPARTPHTSDLSHSSLLPVHCSLFTAAAYRDARARAAASRQQVPPQPVVFTPPYLPARLGTCPLPRLTYVLAHPAGAQQGPFP